MSARIEIVNISYSAWFYQSKLIGEFLLMILVLMCAIACIVNPYLKQWRKLNWNDLRYCYKYLREYSVGHFKITLLNWWNLHMNTEMYTIYNKWTARVVYSYLQATLIKYVSNKCLIHAAILLFTIFSYKKSPVWEGGITVACLCSEMLLFWQGTKLSPTSPDIKLRKTRDLAFYETVEEEIFFTQPGWELRKTRDVVFSDVLL